MKLWSLVFVLSLVGCGFHPGTPNFINPHIQNWHIDCGTVRAPLCGKLSNAMLERGYQIRADAPAQLQLLSLSIAQINSPIGATVARQYYDVNAVLTYSIHIGPNTKGIVHSLRVQRLTMTNSNQIEGSQRELGIIQTLLMNQLTELLLVRIAHYENSTRTTEKQP